MPKLKAILIILMSSSLLVFFQNCSGVSFETAPAAQKVVDAGDLDGTPIDDDNADDIEDEIEDRHDRDEEVPADPRFACGSGNNAKVYICHFPPGNPAAAHTICVSAKAIHAHLHHGSNVSSYEQDLLGKCEDLL